MNDPNAGPALLAFGVTVIVLLVILWPWIWLVRTLNRIADASEETNDLLEVLIEKAVKPVPRTPGASGSAKRDDAIADDILASLDPPKGSRLH